MEAFFNKNVVIVGGGRGIGRDLAMEFARLRANIFLIHDVREELQDTEHHIGNMKVRIYGYLCNFLDQKHINKIITLFKREFLYADVLINSLEIGQKDLFFKYTADEIEETLSTELLSQIRITNLLYGDMVERKQGTVVNIESIDYNKTDNILAGIYSNSMQALSNGINDFASGAGMNNLFSLYVSRSFKNYYSTENSDKIVKAVERRKEFIRL
ncbi:MAG: SDR family NAD(P)-dependent oxidoreductase [Spirochaetes bacterium]|nr:SDR family NAD(P)-dependent oxidoreductase [Spirochaetota bacterium]